MPKTIRQEVDYIAESMGLLQHLAIGEKFADLQESLNKKYAYPFREGIRKFELLGQIEESAEKAFGKDMEEIRYYFAPYEGRKVGCAGKAALLWEGAGYPKATDLSEIARFLTGLSETEYCKKFIHHLQGILSPIQIDEPEAQDAGEPFTVISHLMGLDLSDSDKWKLQKIFFDRAEHQEKVMALMERAASLLRDFSKGLDALARDFCRFWTGEFQDASPSSFLKDRLHIDIGENPLGFFICPDFLYPNAGSLFTELDDDGRYKHPDIFRIGILFGEDFPLKTSQEQTGIEYGNYVSQALKLLGDKSKFEILSYIRDKEAYGSELAKRLGLTTATISHHMGALLNANLVEVKRIDKRVYYTSNKKALEEVLDYSRRQLLGGYGGTSEKH